MPNERERERVAPYRPIRLPVRYTAEAGARGFHFPTGASEVRNGVTYHQFATQIDEDSQEPCGDFLMLGFDKGHYRVPGELVFA